MHDLNGKSIIPLTLVPNKHLRHYYSIIVVFDTEDDEGMGWR
jgi:hypothetical protein